MAGTVNRVILVGNLGRNPEVRRTNDGMPIVNLSVATSERRHDSTTGERREHTEWHRVVIFNERLGEVRNLSTILRHRRFLFTDSLLLLWKWRVG